MLLVYCIAALMVVFIGSLCIDMAAIPVLDETEEQISAETEMARREMLTAQAASLQVGGVVHPACIVGAFRLMADAKQDFRSKHRLPHQY